MLVHLVCASFFCEVNSFFVKFEQKNQKKQIITNSFAKNKLNL